MVSEQSTFNMLCLLIIISLLKYASGYSVVNLMKDYLSSRDKIFHREKSCHLGQNIQLDWNELAANAHLMKHKLRELDESMLSGK